MGDLTRAVLHEVMEQQTVSIAKAGVICTLNARTAILASANPRESRYNPNLSVVENLQLPPTLLSRFDLIYLILDKPDERTDRKLANHLVSLYWGQQTAIPDTLPLETITKYIAFAKKTCHPKISQGAGDLLEAEYVKMRMAGMTGGRRTISATPRQLEALIRMSGCCCLISTRCSSYSYSSLFILNRGARQDEVVSLR
jgi:DNA replication licensing factor MCM4